MKVKRAVKDFSVSDLPKNRWEVFADCIKVRYSLFLLMGVTLLVFALPLFFVNVLNDNTLSSFYYAFENGEMGQEDMLSLVRSADSIYSLFYIPCYVVLSIGVAGIMFIIRQLVWGEGVFFMSDLFDGIKSNLLNYALIAAFIGFFVYVMKTFLPLGENIFSVIVPIVFTIFIVPPMLFIVSQVPIYKNNFFGYILNGFSIYVRTVPQTLVFLILFFLPVLLGFNILPFFVKYVLMIVYFLFLAPLLLTGWFLYSCSAFDRLVNKDNYPEIYDKGVYRTGKADNGEK